MLDTIDEKRLFSKIKNDLEEWRELILLFYSLINWDNKFYPAILFGMITINFIILWYFNLSTLTLIALLLFVIVIFDYALPKIIKIIFKPQNWTGIQENKYEEVCNEICKIRKIINYYYNLLFTVKEQQSTMFFIGVSSILLLFAWIGCVVDNLLLTYLITLIITFYPGLQRHGIINVIKSQFKNVVLSRIQIKEKCN